MLSILSYTFFQYALLGALLSSLLCACVGSYVVTRRLVIAGGGMAHASLGGVGMGAAAFALVGGLGIDWLSRRRDVRSDSAVAMIWTLGMSIGILFAYLAPGFMTDLPTYLFGDILSISRSDLQLMGLLTAFTLLFFFVFERIIVTVAYDPDFARTQGLPVRAFETALTLIMALTIVGCLRMVGIILVVSLLSIPQLTAGLFVRSFRNMVLVCRFCRLPRRIVPVLSAQCSLRRLDHRGECRALFPCAHNKIHPPTFHKQRHRPTSITPRPAADSGRLPVTPSLFFTSNTSRLFSSSSACCSPAAPRNRTPPFPGGGSRS